MAPKAPKIAFTLAFALLLFVLPTPSSFADEAVGRWRGTWSSADTGHRGPLRAVIRPSSTGGYKALFFGRFAGVIPFAYRADLLPNASASGHYTSTKRLPLLGEYNMHATVSGNAFHATFRGGRDVGVFQMRRR